jgi:hypothetical protein
MVLYSDCKAGEGERQGRDKIKGGGKENEKRELYLLSSGNNTSRSAMRMTAIQLFFAVDREEE